MSVPTPLIIVEPFGLNAVAADITVPIPVPTQLPANPSRASFNDGFPPINFIPVSAGGIPPAGKDFNGLFYMITAYLAAFQGGMLPGYDAGASTAFGGYPLGAILRKIGSLGFWISTVAANTSDPETGGANWSSIVPTPTKALQLGVAAGTYNNYLPAGFGPFVGFLDLTPSGAVIITGSDSTNAGDGQQLIITNLSGANPLTLNALDAGSLAQNRFRMPGNFTLGQNNSIRFVYSKDLSLWIQS